MYCSPSHVKYSTKGTCFSPRDLKMITEDINKEKKVIPKTGNKKTVEKYFEKKCGHKEYCWLDYLSHNTKQKLEHAFRPKKPLEWNKNPRTWLNTDDIYYVMSQYEHLYKDFKFLGVHSIDFASFLNNHCISSNNLCEFDLKNYKKYKRFGLVLNLDRHDQSGSHWVAIYFNINPKLANFGVYFYDSTAPSLDEISDEIIEFMAKVKHQVQRDMPKDVDNFETKMNTVQRQFKNTECGMFSMVFLTQCMKNIPFKTICQRMKTDDGINKMRKILYRPNK